MAMPWQCHYQCGLMFTTALFTVCDCTTTSSCHTSVYSLASVWENWLLQSRPFTFWTCSLL